MRLSWAASKLVASICVIIILLSMNPSSASQDSSIKWSVNEFVRTYEYSVGDGALLEVELVASFDTARGTLEPVFDGIDAYLNVTVLEITATRVFLDLDLYIEEDDAIKYLFRDLKAEKDITSPFIYIDGRKGIFLLFTSPDFIQAGVYEYRESLNGYTLEGNVSIVKDNGYPQVESMVIMVSFGNRTSRYGYTGGSNYVLIIENTIYIISGGPQILETSIPAIKYVPRVDLPPIMLLLGWIMTGLLSLGVPYPLATIIAFLSFPLILLAVLIVVWRFFRRRA